MFEFIAFIFKIAFATFFGALLVFPFDGSEIDNDKVIYSSLLALFSCTLIAVALQFPIEISGIVTGASVIVVFMTTLYLNKNIDIKLKIENIFSSIIGMIIASGLIFQAIVFAISIIFLKRYSNTILDSLKIVEEEENI